MVSSAIQADLRQPFPWHRRIRANLHYLRQPLVRFLPLLGFLGVVLAVGAVCFHQLYEPPLSYGRALYITYCLVFMEHLLAFPNHWVLRVFYFALPPLGLVVILDGIVHFSYHFLRRDERGPEWIWAVTRTMDNHVILCGLGKVGLRVLEQLLQLKEQVVVLEKDPQCPNLAFARSHNVPAIVGSSREQGIFDKLNIARAKSIILATNDDLANLEMALDARKLKPGIRVVLRMYDQELADKIEDSFDIHLAFSTSAVAAPLFATSSSDRSIINSFYVGEQLLVVARMTVRPGSRLVEKQIKDLGADQHVFVLSHGRSGETAMFPGGNVTFNPGDEITVQSAPDVLRQLHKLNDDPEPY